MVDKGNAQLPSNDQELVEALKLGLRGETRVELTAELTNVLGSTVVALAKEVATGEITDSTNVVVSTVRRLGQHSTWATAELVSARKIN